MEAVAREAGCWDDGVLGERKWEHVPGKQDVYYPVVVRSIYSLHWEDWCFLFNLLKSRFLKPPHCHPS